MKYIGLFLLLFTNPPYAQSEFKIEDCTVKNKIEVCMNLGPQYNAEFKREEALLVTHKLCELTGESCDFAYSMAINLKSPKAASILRYMELNCSANNVKTCESLSSYYEVEKKDYANAILKSRFAFNKNKKGRLGFLLYGHGDKIESYKVMNETCKHDIVSCSFYLRNTKGNPEVADLAARVENKCKTSPFIIQGVATDWARA